MKIETKFKPGDTVCVTNKVSESVECSFCSGKGFLSAVVEGCGGKSKPIVVDCPEDGCEDGWIWGERKHQVSLTGGKVTNVNISISKNLIVSVRYSLGLNGDYHENDLFSTVEEAQAWCDKENNKGEQDGY